MIPLALDDHETLGRDEGTGAIIAELRNNRTFKGLFDLSIMCGAKNLILAAENQGSFRGL